MKKICTLALASLLLAPASHAINLDSIQLWAGSGTNRAALVIDWNSPLVFNNTSVPAPIATKTLVWGYRFNGAATGTQMLNAILAADPRLYVVEDDTYGTFVEGIGYNLSGNGAFGITDGTTVYNSSAFINGVLTDPGVDPDAAYALNGGDLYWGGYYGPNWSVWNELGDTGGFLASPNRGSSQYWDTNTFTHGQWALSYYGLDSLPLTNGSWIGFSVAAAGYDTNAADPATYAYNVEEQAPPSPEGTYAAYVCNTNDFAVQVTSSSGIDTMSPYNSPAAVLGRPTLKFIDSDGGGAVDRVKIIEPPYDTAPDGSPVITEILKNGQITVDLGRKVHDDPNNPYGIDLIVYGNSFFSASGTSGFIDDGTDLDTATLSSSIFSHAATVSVSQDGTNWCAFPTTSGLFPDNAYRWDETNHSWTDEQMNPTKPLNPALSASSFTGQTVAAGLDQFIGAAGGTGYDLKTVGLPWIQFVRVQPKSGTYTVIDAIAAVDPVVLGDDLSITPANLTGGITNLVFQNPASSGQTLVALDFHSISGSARISTIALTDLSPFAPISGTVSSAYQITPQPVSGTGSVTYLADVSLRAGSNYNGTGADLELFQWTGAAWSQPAFTYNPATQTALVSQVTNLSAFVIAQLPPVKLAVQCCTNGIVLSFNPVANWQHTVQTTTDFSHWTPVTTLTPTNTATVFVTNNAPPGSRAFYRVLLTRP